MEILASTALTGLGIFAGISLLCMVIFGIICSIYISCDSEIASGITGAIFVIAFICTIIGIVNPVPSGEYKYTVEITEESKYKELIEKEYKFKRLYDGREIYEITGAPLEDIEK